MATTTERLSLAEFQQRYGHSDQAYEYWYGEAIPKGIATRTHGFLLGLLPELLKQAGYRAGYDVELRIVPDARPRPDIIATRGKLAAPYRTKAVEVAIEVLSPDDAMPHILHKCSAYHDWGFEFIYVVDPENRKVYRWTGTALEMTATLVSIPVHRIWEALDQALS